MVWGRTVFLNYNLSLVPNTQVLDHYIFKRAPTILNQPLEKIIRHADIKILIKLSHMNEKFNNFFSIAAHSATLRSSTEFISKGQIENLKLSQIRGIKIKITGHLPPPEPLLSVVNSSTNETGRRDNIKLATSPAWKFGVFEPKHNSIGRQRKKKVNKSESTAV